MLITTIALLQIVLQPPKLYLKSPEGDATLCVLDGKKVNVEGHLLRSSGPAVRLLRRTSELWELSPGGRARHLFNLPATIPEGADLGSIAVDPTGAAFACPDANGGFLVLDKDGNTLATIAYPALRKLAGFDFRKSLAGAFAQSLLSSHHIYLGLPDKKLFDEVSGDRRTIAFNIDLKTARATRIGYGTPIGLWRGQPLCFFDKLVDLQAEIRLYSQAGKVEWRLKGRFVQASFDGENVYVIDVLATGPDTVLRLRRANLGTRKWTGSWPLKGLAIADVEQLIHVSSNY